MWAELTALTKMLKSRDGGRRPLTELDLSPPPPTPSPDPNLPISCYFCLLPKRLSLDENVREKEGGKETTGETALRLPSVPFPWSLAVHHQSLASATLRKTKRLRRTRLLLFHVHV